MTPETVNLARSFDQIQEHWRPRIAAEVNGQAVKLVKFKGEFVWHSHAEADELFYVVEGEFVMQFRDRNVTLRQGEFIVVPRGVEHRPVAEHEVAVMLIEPGELRNTGDVYDERLTAPQ
jgi:mannose-6-phosphate isomerase-like protein (cupin superfamily)